MSARLLAALLAAALPLAAARADLPETAQHLAAKPLTVVSGKRTIRFSVEVAKTGEEQEIGLMFRKTMPAMAGMIFPMDPPRMASFWMKNTLIPLDIVFIRADHRISSIAASVAPLVTFPTVDSTEPVAAVLELNGGAAARNGLKPGDLVRW
ncbi:DUF192 domain-containing protein [Sphingomonas nostoxanthinifaciens]|uniref:DUF192 domain-containing protein n=1 Tax=Sphingomonas nostoxanthinifaciens TaxID=2872652 RepID=UPI001CC1E7C9|nr:DUF192 domain-containing protein [Sphingomonas nostoxanthinifaciens]UAK24897.1 DUF192 domain-containing protein [Sphingomonas nostoxanthinifaciens]